MKSTSIECGLFWQPLGGNNIDQISGHCYCYSLLEPDKNTKLLVDLGKFDNYQALGIKDAIAAVPDISELLKSKNPPIALLVTHSHPDHLNGVVHYLRAGYKLPKIYGGLYTKLILDDLCNEFNVSTPSFEVIKEGDILNFENIEVEVLSSSHTCFDSFGFIIKTKYVTVYHTGDMKLDASTCFRKPTNIKRLRQRAQEINWVVADFYGVVEDGYAVTEKENLKCFYELIKKNLKKKIFIPVYPTHHEMYILAFLAALKYKKDVVFYGNKDFYCYLSILEKYGINLKKLAKNRINVFHYSEVDVKKIGKNYVVIGTFNDIPSAFNANENNSFGIVTAGTFFNPLRGNFNTHNIPFTDLEKHPKLLACGHGYLKDIEALNMILPNSRFIPTHCPIFVIDYFRNLAKFIKLRLIKHTPQNGQVFKLEKNDALIIEKFLPNWLVSLKNNTSFVKVKQKPTSGEGFLKRTISKRKCLNKFKEYLHKRKKQRR